MLRVGGLVLAALVPTLVYLAGSEPTPASARYDQRQLDYIEDGAGRTVAAIEASLYSDRLEVRIAPVGPQIEPMPGYTGRAGANQLAAEELQRIVEEDLLQVLTRRNGLSSQRGEVRLGAWETLPVRRLRADGRVDFSARSQRTFPIELRTVSPLAGPGCYETVFIVRGEVRLRVRFQLDAAGGRIELLEAVGAGPGREAL